MRRQAVGAGMRLGDTSQELAGLQACPWTALFPKVLCQKPPALMWVGASERSPGRATCKHGFFAIQLLRTLSILSIF